MTSTVAMPWQASALVTVAQVNARRRTYLMWLGFWTLLAIFEAFSQILASRSDSVPSR